MPRCLLLAALLLGLLGARAAAEPDAGLSAAKAAFLQQWGDEYGYGGRFDELWTTEIGPRLPAGEHYIDWTGSALYWNSQVEQAAKELQASVFGNPHSCNPSSARTERAVEELRLRVLRFLGADPAEYDLVWTRSGTGALHILGETFGFGPRSRFAYLVSNHNSVLGIREYARRASAAFGAVSEQQVEAWLASKGGESGGGEQALPAILLEEPDEQQAAAAAAAASQRGAAVPSSLRRLASQRAAQPALAQPADSAGVAAAGDQGVGASDDDGPALSLFAMPAYDNYGGVMYPLRWVRAAQAKSTPRRRWKVLLDAAAFLPAHPLNLTETPADFVDLSFYKLFGFPTGVGALVARKSDIAAARKVYWGGGSVFLATSQLDWKQLKPEGPERFEDGTLPFLQILALEQGLRVYERLGGPAAVQRHTESLRAWLYARLAGLRHSNGAPLLRIMGRHADPDAAQRQGATFNFQLLRPDGGLFSYRVASGVLAEAGFHMRCGCTCNPGACYGFVGLTDEEVRDAAAQAHGNFSTWEWATVKRPGPDGRPRSVRLPLGSLRASLGSMSRFEDAYALATFLERHYTDASSDAEVAASVAAEVPAELRAQRMARLTWAHPSDPGWC